MAMREIDENEYAELRRVADVASVIGKNEKARLMLQEAVAIAAPDQAGPEIRIRKEVSERTSGMEAKLDAFLEEQRKERETAAAESARQKMEGQWLAGRRKIREAGYTDEGVAKLEEWMEKRNVADHEIAVAAYERENPPPEPVVTGGSRWNFFDSVGGNSGDAALDQFMKTGNDDQFLSTMIPEALKEARGR